MLRKKIISIILSVVALAGVYTPANATISLKLNDEEVVLSRSPFMKEDVIMVPIRDIAETAQFIVSWDNETSSVYLLRGKEEIQIPIDSDVVVVCGETINLPCTPIVQNGVTYVPFTLVKAIVKADNSMWDELTKVASINSDDLFMGGLIGSANKGDGGSNYILEYDFSTFIAGVDYEPYVAGVSFTSPWVLNGSSRYDEINQCVVLNHFFNRITTPELEPGAYTLQFDLKGGSLGKRPEFFFNPPAATSWWYHHSLQSDLADKTVFTWTDSGANSRARYYLPKIPTDKWTTYKFAFRVSENEPVTFYLGAEGDDTYLDNVKLVKGIK